MSVVSYRYEIENDFVVKIWKSDIEEGPVIFQSSWPDMSQWANKEEAEAWAQQWILSREDDLADLPGNNPENPTMPRS